MLYLVLQLKLSDPNVMSSKLSNGSLNSFFSLLVERSSSQDKENEFPGNTDSNKTEYNNSIRTNKNFQHTNGSNSEIDYDLNTPIRNSFKDLSLPSVKERNTSAFSPLNSECGLKSVKNRASFAEEAIFFDSLDKDSNGSDTSRSQIRKLTSAISNLHLPRITERYWFCENCHKPKDECHCICSIL